MKKVWILSVLIMIVVTIYQITTTFAKYVSEAYAEAEQEVGVWIIKVNDTDISDSSTQQKDFIIDTLNYNPSQYVVNGKIAPGSVGYFDVVIDATETSVAVIYDLEFDFSSLDINNSLKFDKIVRVKNDGTEEPIIRTGINTYSSLITLDQISKKELETVRIYIVWENDDSEENNKFDSETGLIQNLNLKIPVQALVNQYLGEEIIEYKEPTEGGETVDPDNPDNPNPDNPDNPENPDNPNNPDPDNPNLENPNIPENSETGNGEG